MSRFLSNSHTHSIYCDGKNKPEEMIAAAKANGFVSLGFSGHADPGFASKWSMKPENQIKYIEHIRSLQPSHDGVRIWCGAELDAMATPEALEKTRGLDYRLGSMHYFYAADHAPQADGDPDVLKKYMDDEFCGDGIALAKRYYDILVEFVNREKPEIIGHFDLIRKWAAKMQLFDENSPAYRKVALDALERAFPCGGVLEVNTGGIARNYIPDPYPTQELLNAWREMGGKVTITSDCHDCANLTCAYDLAYDLIKQAGFRSIHRLGAGEALWDEVEI